MRSMTRSDFLVGTLSTAALPTVGGFKNAQTALDRYVAAPDPSYGYRLMSTFKGRGFQAYLLEVTSQRWRASSEVNEPIWTHWLTIVEPDEVRTTVGMLVIAGGANTDPPPGRADALLVTLALDTHAVSSGLQQVPNQPLQFPDEPGGLSEDDLIAYSWLKFLRSGDETWPLRLPMTKAVIRAMDTITAFCSRRGSTVDRFIVGGASKRGWTSWTTAAADKRVAAFVPVVADVLDMVPNIRHEYQCYGRWPRSLDSYVKFGIVKWFGTPQLRALAEIEDPYSYRSRYTMPKLIINAAGDDFFVPDSSQFYFADLPPKKYLRYLPNTDHSLNGAQTSIADTILAFCHSVVDGVPLPTMTWQFEGGDAIAVRATAMPSMARMWEAADRNARDFRVEKIGKAFNYHDLRNGGDNTCVGRISPPQRGWRAFFVELTYPTETGHSFTMTTDVRVVPDVLPFPPPPVSRRDVGVAPARLARLAAAGSSQD
jgi:PhoPQ-activated pathogenicity-related protein